MPYRIIAAQAPLCIICSAATSSRCRNCSGAHCALHMPGDNCWGCQSELRAIERRQVHRVTATTAWMSVWGVAMTAIATGVASYTWIALVCAFLLVGLVRVASTRIVAERLANHALPPTSVPMALPAPAQASAADASERESEYSIRRRRNKGVVRNRAPRAVFMTRGGYFYQ
jgi:hypothetical protein